MSDTNIPNVLNKWLGVDPIVEVFQQHHNKGVLVLGWHEDQVVDVTVESCSDLRLGEEVLEYKLQLKPQSHLEEQRQMPLWLESEEDELVDPDYRIFLLNKFHSSLKLLSWNVRGAASNSFNEVFTRLKHTYKPNIVILTETKVSGPKAEQICASLDFDGHFKEDAMGMAGGIWLLWKSNEGRVDIMASTSQEVHSTIRVLHGSPLV